LQTTATVVVTEISFNLNFAQEMALLPFSYISGYIKGMMAL